MGKHERGYARVEHDRYPTPSWCIDALAEHIELQARRVWECAAGAGSMTAALKSHGAEVFSSDIEDHSGIDCMFDFLAPGLPPGLAKFNLIITNPPWSRAGAFIEAGLRRIAHADAAMALLLPADHDSAVSRTRFFGDCPYFLARIILTARPAWFQRSDGRRPAPKENCAWFVWARPVLRLPASPLVRYALARPPGRTNLGDRRMRPRCT
jgi:hypothetical protein